MKERKIARGGWRKSNKPTLFFFVPPVLRGITAKVVNSDSIGHLIVAE